MVLANRDEGPYLARGRLYVRRPEPVHFPAELPLPDDGGELVPETGRHLLLRTGLFLTLRHAFGGRALVSSEQFVYWDPTDSGQCVCPDVAVRVGGPSEPVDVWRTWELGAPHVVIEIVSDHDRSSRERDRKLQRYRRAGVAELVWFDARDSTRPIRLFDSFDGDMVERTISESHALRSDALGVYWTVVPDAVLGPTLRPARDAKGDDLLPTPEEEERQIREEERRAKETALARVRELEALLARKD